MPASDHGAARIGFHDPILGKPVHWEALHTFNPAAVVRDGKVYVLYRAEDDSGTMQIGMHTSRLGLAVSEDGEHFTREAAPVFYPAKDSEQAREWPGGTEDPRVVESPDGGYVLTYTQWNRETYRVGIATSPDLHTWTKHGPAFGMGKYGGLKYKSAGIVTECVTKGRCIAAKTERPLLDVLGRGRDSPGDIGRSGALDAGGGREWRAKGADAGASRASSTADCRRWGRRRC